MVKSVKTKYKTHTVFFVVQGNIVNILEERIKNPLGNFILNFIAFPKVLLGFQLDTAILIYLIPNEQK